MGSILILCTLLLSINSYVFAQDAKKYKNKDDCIKQLNANTSTFSKCEELAEKARTCTENSKDNIEEICNTRYKSFFPTCKSLSNPSLKSDCETEIYKYTDKCIKDWESDPQNTAGCKTQEDAATKCTEDTKKTILKTCTELFPFDETIPDANNNCGNGTKDEKEECDDGNKKNDDGCSSECKLESVIPPTIPNISTVVKPNVKNVTQVSPYLSSTFLPRVANTIVSFGIGAAVLGLILGSIGLLTAYGNDEKYGNAKKGIYFSLIGLIICLLAFAIVQLIFYTGFQAAQIR